MEILIIIASVILAFEIALNSELADSIKGLLKLKLSQQQTLELLSHTLVWNAFWGIKWYVVMYPMTLMLCLIFRTLYWLNKLTNCPFCIGYHISWIGLYFITDTGFFMALFYALFSILAGKLYERIN